MYRTGELVELIRIERKAEVDDGLGGFTLSWTLLGEERAHIRPRRGSERVEAGGLRGVASFLCVIRRRQDVRVSDRVIWRGEPFDIVFAGDSTARGRYLELELERGGIS